MFLIETNPSFLIFQVGDSEYVFYNSNQHIGCRLLKIEIMILDMYYRYRDARFIVSKFPVQHHNIIAAAIDKIEKMNLINEEEISYEEDLEKVRPRSFYIHLTYNCNLRCSYCYNRDIRKLNTNILNFDNWKLILDKILPTAHRFTLTGGECFLYPDIAKIIEYIRSYNPNISISCISNGMHDFDRVEKWNFLSSLSSINFSCDSIDRAGERHGFDATLFKKNVSAIRERHPNLPITISSTYTCNNFEDLKKIHEFCQMNGCQFSRTMIVPENIEDIELVPSLEEINNKILTELSDDDVKQLHTPKFRCGAGKEIWSIDPIGNVYPCQSLHYPELRMGNLLEDNVEDIRFYASQEQTLPTVSELPVCSKCNVRYICGGGCLANGYHLNGNKPGRNHLTCILNKANCISLLQRLNNRL